jgi:hypothetical protein
MEAPVEICYLGVVIGRTQEQPLAADGGTSFFLAVREPMPVGSVVRLRSTAGETLARVVHAVEASDPALSGMQVRLIDPTDNQEEAAREWIPPPPAPEEARPAREPAKTAMAVIEVTPPVAPSPPPAEPALLAPSPPPAEPALIAPSSPPVAATDDSTAHAPNEGAEAGDVDGTAPNEPYAVDHEAQADGPSSDEATGDARPSPSPAAEELPPARPISTGGGRRKAKRRK